MLRGYLLSLLFASLIFSGSMNVIPVAANKDMQSSFNPDLELQTRSSRDAMTSTFLPTHILNQPGGSLAGGITLGDPDNDGRNEVIVVGGSAEAGRVTVIKYNHTRAKFDTPTIWIDSQALVDVESADFDPHSAGEELVVGGYSNNVTAIYWPGGQAQPRTNTIDTLTHQIFGLAVGDINSSHSGLELAAVDGKTDNLSIYQSTSTPDEWNKITIQFNETLRNVHIGDYDSNSAGEEIIVLSTNGSVFSVAFKNDKWESEFVWRDSDKLLDAAIGDVDSRFDGNEIITVGLSRHATMLRKTATGSWEIENIWNAPGGLEGIDIGNFEPSSDSNEIAIGGYNNSVVMLFQDTDNWPSKEIFEDKDSSQSELNGVVVGDFYPGHDGNELMVVGASGITTMLNHELPDFTMESSAPVKKVAAGEKAVFTIIIKALSNFHGNINLDVQGELSWELSSTSVSVPGSASLTVQTDNNSAPGTYSFNITASYMDNKKSLGLSVEVESAVKPDFTFTVSPKTFELERLPEGESGNGEKADNEHLYSQVLVVKVQGLSGFNEPVKINVTGLPEYFEAILSIDEILPGEQSELSIRIISNPPSDDNNFSIGITGKTGELVKYEFIEIKLKPSSVSQGDGPTSDDKAKWIQLARGILLIAMIILIIITLIKIKRKKNELLQKESRNGESSDQ